MNIFIGGLITETNTFSPLPTGMKNFEETALFFGDATQHKPRWGSGVLHRWRGMSEDKGYAVTEGLFAMAQPAGRVVRSVYNDLLSQLLADIKAAPDLDIILLSLHGAMAAEGIDDCEGHLLAEIRKFVGDKAVIGVELDLHCHITSLMTEHADIVITYKEYPHTDVEERGEELFRLCERIKKGAVAPHLTFFDCRVINLWRTAFEPMRDIVSLFQEAEAQDKILSVSFGHGFPWADVEDVGAKLLVYTDDAPDLGATCARELFDTLWSHRDQTGVPWLALEQGFERAKLAKSAATGSGPVVIADVTDNPGGGAAGDNTTFLKYALDIGLENAAISPLWDPVAVMLCMEAGVGASFDLRLGGKCGPASASPLDLRVTVKELKKSAVQHMGGVEIAMGDAACVSVGGIDLVINSIRTQTLGLDAFSALGLDPEACDYLIVKSMNHFSSEFAPIAKELVYVAGDGALQMDFAKIPYTKLKNEFWPRSVDPFHDDAASPLYVMRGEA